MAKLKAPSPAAAAAPVGTFIYFLLKPDGTVLASFGAGTATLDGLLAAGWTALRETALTTGGALLGSRRGRRPEMRTPRGGRGRGGEGRGTAQPVVRASKTPRRRTKTRSSPSTRI